MPSIYGTAIVPARVRKPQDKIAVEASVRLVETWIIAALRDMKFFSLRELNEAVAEKLEELNNRKFKQHIGTRCSAYLEEEQASEKWVDFAAEFWHYECISRHSKKAFTNKYQRWCKNWDTISALRKHTVYTL